MKAGGKTARYAAFSVVLWRFIVVLRKTLEMNYKIYYYLLCIVGRGHATLVTLYSKHYNTYSRQQEGDFYENF